MRTVTETTQHLVRDHMNPWDHPATALGVTESQGMRPKNSYKDLSPELPHASCFMLMLCFMGEKTGTVCICSTAHLPWGNLIIDTNF